MILHIQDIIVGYYLSAYSSSSSIKKPDIPNPIWRYSVAWERERTNIWS